MTDTTGAPGPGEEPVKPASAPPNPSAPPPRAAPRPQFVRGGLGTVAAVGLLVVLGVIIGSHWPSFSSAPPSEVSADDQAAIVAPRPSLTPAPTVLPNTAPAPGAVLPGFGEFATRLGAVEARLGTVETATARAADRDVQSSLQARVARLESESSGEALRHAGGVLALATLSRAAGEARPYRVQFDALAALEPDDPALAMLESYADAGVPTIAMLAARFPDAARDALDADRAANAGDGFVARLWSSFTGLIRVRRIGDVKGGTNADRLARAEADLMRNDIGGAVTETRSLQGAAATAMAAWLKDASARFTLDSALAAIDARLVQQIAASKAMQPPQPESPPVQPRPAETPYPIPNPPADPAQTPARGLQQGTTP